MPGAPPPRRPGPPLGIDTSTPFGRLALTHVLGTGGDALVALVLAGSLFFSVDPSGARWRIALYLLFTMAPFAVVGPFIGPAMDRARGGRRWMLTVATGGRAVVAMLMVSSAGTDSLLLFPEAFVMLVLAKSYQVAKAAIVPTVVHSDEELVEANSKLQMLSGIAAFAAGVPGALMLWLFPPSALAGLCAVVFLVATFASLRVPATRIAAAPEAPAERAELRSAAVLSAASAMGTLRWVVGFLTFLLAFALRGDGSGADQPVWHFGVIVALSGVGGLVGAAVAPHVRRRTDEEWLLLAALVVASLAGVAGLTLAGLPGQAIMAFAVASSASSGKQAFDALVQRDAPDANRGRFFARFESRFQVIWVLGAAVPVVVTIPTRFGATVICAVTAAAAVFWWLAIGAVRRGQAPPKLPDARTIGREARRHGRRFRSRPPE